MPVVAIYGRGVTIVQGLDFEFYRETAPLRVLMNGLQYSKREKR